MDYNIFNYYFILNARKKFDSSYHPSTYDAYKKKKMIGFSLTHGSEQTGFSIQVLMPYFHHRLRGRKKAMKSSLNEINLKVSV